MPERLRLFVAADVPGDRLAAVQRSTSALRRALGDARWVAPANQHVTLKFLGYVTSDLLPAVQEACALVARSHRPARVGLAPLGAFPSPRRARVVWAGLDDPGGLLASLAAALDGALEPLGFAAEKRAFTPHLTLARLKSPRRLDEPFPELGPAALAPFDVDAVALYQSHLSPKGARYEVIEGFPLGGAAVSRRPSD
jgi:RNA 2',3'-cyclic 3'-phosphodiesterase